MSHINWGVIAKKFDQEAHQQEMQKKQHNLYMKALYKQQLQQMIAQQKHKTLDSKKYDRQLIQQLQHRDESQLAREYQKQRYLKKMKQKFSHDNFQVTIDRRKQQRQERQRQKQLLSSKFRKAATQMSQQSKKYAKYKSQAKSLLSHAYQQQMDMQQQRKLTQKAEDRKYSLLAMQEQNKKQIDRMRQLNKLKFGYYQNPETYHYAQKIWKRNLENRNKFINNMSHQNTRILQQLERRKKDQDHKKIQIKSISEFNRGMFQERVFQRKYASVKQALQQNQRLTAIQRDLQEQAKRKQLQKLQRQQRLKQQLQKQIEQTQSIKTESKYLSYKQQNLNRDILSSSGHSVLPGLSQDYTYKRQQRLLQNFLKGSRHTEHHQHEF